MMRRPPREDGRRSEVLGATPGPARARLPKGSGSASETPCAAPACVHAAQSERLGRASVAAPWRLRHDGGTVEKSTDTRG